MRVSYIIFLFCCCLFAPFTKAVSLIENQAAIGIANTLEGYQQNTDIKTLQESKNALKKYAQVQQERVENIENLNSPSQEQVPEIFNSRSNNSNNFQQVDFPETKTQEALQSELKQSTKEEVERALKAEKIEQETNPVDYKQGIQVFYKNKCKNKKESCARGPLLTNIKSVIFDYAKARGSFVSQIKK